MKLDVTSIRMVNENRRSRYYASNQTNYLFDKKFSISYGIDTGTANVMKFRYEEFYRYISCDEPWKNFFKLTIERNYL